MINNKKILLFLIAVWPFLVSCASVKQPKVRLVPVMNQAMPRMTLGQIQNLRPIIYFKAFDKEVTGYKVTWKGVGGGIIFEKDMKLEYKDTIRVWPIRWEVQAYNAKGKSSKSAKLFIQ